MFFIGIFGIENKEEHIRDINAKICKSCGQYTTYRLYKTYSYFHFFFIKLFKFNENYYAVSRCCNRLFEVPHNIGKNIEKGLQNDIEEKDLIEINMGYNEGVCPNCKNLIHPSFEFCPYCGTKLH
ncbi:zinc ribbon domain-containing protein [Thermobrachium celere]|uniref:zinc ribbon domain-containing protein n=1 Tax=Thermobrachium celere TaxID=53422 RepID=UPI001944DC96|nr:zinc ribbon domain-containing protein [Thermobrachium celere]GFR36161.1 zinc ribbon domain-containing protein [Thermobrachium celere]